MSETTSAPVFLTVAQFCDKHPWAKPGGIRHAIFFGKDNGFEACTVRFGRKLLLDEAAVIAWIRERGTARGSLKQGSPTEGREARPARGAARRSGNVGGRTRGPVAA